MRVFDVILEVIVKITLFWYVTPCGLVQTKVSEESGTSINPVFNWASPELQGILYQILLGC
jgi:hypothetical protein